ncbi:MAG: chemotaxis protein CheD [Pirellulaceae bacterium]
MLACAGEKLSSVLGSCVGVVLYHPRMRLAALAHVVLPDSVGRSGQPGKFADKAIPEMLRMLAAEGANASGLIAKIAGGANMFGTAAGPMQIGEGNAEAVKKLLRDHRLRLESEHLGGSKGRRVTFDCDTGMMTIEIVGSENATI